MSCKIKKEKVFIGLKELKCDNSFSIIKETNNDVWFQTERTIFTGICIITLIVRNTVVNDIIFLLGTLNNPSKKETMLNLFNEFNSRNSVFNFYLFEDYIQVKIPYIADNNNFNGSLAIDLINTGFKALCDEYYPKIMKVIWS